MNKSLRVFVISFSLLVILSLTIGCAQKNNLIEDGSGELESATLVIATPTQIPWWVDEQIPYPTSPEGFILNAGGSETGARDRIIELGAEDDLKALEDIYSQELVRIGKNPENYTFEAMVWENGGRVYWDSVVKDNSGHFLGMKLTKGAEAGRVVRAFGLTRYIMEYAPGTDFFDFFTLPNPPEFPDAVQQMVWDNSGWHVAGAFTPPGALLAWFDADVGEAGQWLILPEAIPSSTPTEKAEAQDIWQVSPDGHLVYNEAQLYEGMFTIDKEHPEYTEKYWEDTIRGLWNLNYVGENTSFLNQFPTNDSLIKYLKEGGGLVSNLWIPVIYPNAKTEFYNKGTLKPVGDVIDLSKIAISIYKPTLEEIYHYSPSYATGTKYISFNHGGEELFIQKININGNKILQFTFRKDILMDTEYFTGRGKISTLAFSEQKTPDENLLAATQMINSWTLRVQMETINSNYSERGTLMWISTINPPLLNLSNIIPWPQDYENISSSEGSPLAICK